MKDEKAPEWNSKEPAISGLTCEEAGTFLTGMVTYYRAMISAAQKSGNLGAMEVARNCIEQLSKIADSPTLSDGEREQASNRLPIAMMALGQALMISTSNDKINPGELSGIASAGLNSFIQAIKDNKDKTAGSFLDFAVRKRVDGKDNKPMIEIGVSITPLSEMVKRYSPEQLKVVKEVVHDIMATEVKQGDN